MRAIGLTCGIGSMLVGARQAGFEILGNVEWRKYYFAEDAEGRNTFRANFPGAFFKRRIEDLSRDEIERIMGVELALGHPECGAYSQLNAVNTDSRAERAKDAGDIPLFTALVARTRPRFFAMDDLPPSLVAYPMSAYAEALPDYDLFPEWVSNFNYGNVQRHRKRMFMIGARKEERFVFSPGESENALTVADVIGDLPTEPRPRGNFPNHDPHCLDEECQRGLGMEYLGHRPSWREVRDWFAKARPVETFRYVSPTTGDFKNKPGWYKARWDGGSPVLDGGSGHMHPLRNLPFTIRERARIQGFPDDFVFYGTKFNEAGEWDHVRNVTMLKQTGKAMPVQFNRYFSIIVRDHILGRPSPEVTGRRFLSPNPHVDEAKRWYCSNVGYSDQARACGACWMSERCEIKRDKYGFSSNKDTAGRPAADSVPSRIAMKVPAELVPAVRKDETPRSRTRNAPVSDLPKPIYGKGVSNL